MFGLDIRRTELAGLIPRKENYAPGFLRITFKHKPIPPEFLRKRHTLRQTPDPTALLCIYIARSPKRYPPSKNVLLCRNHSMIVSLLCLSLHLPVGFLQAGSD